MSIFDWTPETQAAYDKHPLFYDVMTWVVIGIILLIIVLVAWVPFVFFGIEVLSNLLAFLFGEIVFVILFFLCVAMSWLMPVSLTVLAFLLGAGLLDNFFIALMTGMYVGTSAFFSAISRNFLVSNLLFIVGWFLWYFSAIHRGPFVPLHWHDFNPFYLYWHSSEPID
jgi:hypothetical protein